MNSKDLQKKFAEEYKKFFQNNDLVISGNFSFPWGYEGISNNLSSLNLKIKSTIPLKCYIGFNMINKPAIVINDLLAYNIVSDNFEIYDIEKINKEIDKIEDLLLGKLKKLNLGKGIKINILAETNTGHSVGFFSTIGCILAFGIYTLYDYYSQNNDEISTQTIKKKYYNKIISLGGKIDYISRYGNSNIHNVFFALDGINGISFFLLKDNISYKKFDKIKSLKFKNGTIDNPNKLDFPFDYYIVFSGLPADTKLVEYNKKMEFHDDHITYFIKKILNHNYKLNKIFKFDLINIEKIKILELLYYINKKPYDENLIESFIKQVNKYSYMIGIHEEQNDFGDDFKYFFKKNKSNQGELVGICPNYTGRLGGGYIIVTKFGLSRTTIEKTISDLRELYPNVAIEYNSYYDGTHKSEGVKINQFISNGFFSKYIDANLFVFKNNKTQYIGEYNYILSKEKNSIILDTIKNKIYYNGEKLTSNDLPSQNATIELLIKLLENPQKNISNRELSLSSYSKNKNDMLGKIILPFNKYIENKTQLSIKISCKGSINDFYIKIPLITDEIGIIKEL